jgi:hypothetical protein
MESNEPYPIEVTQSINAFLDRIEQVLLNRGTPRAERTSICSEVETQIHTLIERKVEAGAELNLDLVTGIIESMDPPESYAASVEPIAHAEPLLQAEPVPSISNKMKKKPVLDYFRSFVDRPPRTSPELDWVAICGLVATCFGLLFIAVGLRSISEEGEVLGFLVLFAGVIVSGISFWRIRHSNGLLTGQRIASIGVLMLPLVIVNLILGAILFASPFGRFLGAVVMAVALLYLNYRMVQYALHWLSCYSAKGLDAAPSKPEPSADSAVPSGMIIEGNA